MASKTQPLLILSFSFAMKRQALYISIPVVLLGMWVFTSYNGFISANEAVDASWSQVETQYQRRVDLVPNLVSTVKGAAAFEKDTFESVTAARTQWQDAGSRSESVSAANALEGSLSRLLLTVENYPQLQATAGFRDLMTQLEGTENRIAVARRDYNETVRQYNVRVKQFPSMMIANLFGFDAAEFFESIDGADEAPTVEF